MSGFSMFGMLGFSTLFAGLQYVGLPDVFESSKYYQCYKGTLQVINIINEMVLVVEKPDGLGEKTVFESGSS